MHKNRIGILPAGILGALLLLSPFPFSACDTLKPDISITIQSDYNGIIEAVRSVNRSLEEKLKLIETAIARGFADGKDAQELFQQAVASLSGTMAERMAAIETALNSQTTSLETKLGLIEAAIQEGLADEGDGLELIHQALLALNGTMEEKLAAIETALTSQTTSLETKLQAIRDALAQGLADEATAIGLVKTAIASLQGNVTDIAAVLGEIDAALKADGSVGLAIGNILTALNGRPDYASIFEAIQHALYFYSHNINGYEYVEMGHIGEGGPVLKWATMNVGATQPQERGDHFAWAETAPYYSSLSPLTWKAGMENGYVAESNQYFSGGTYTRYHPDTDPDYSSYGYADDPARANWGSTWRTPTYNELKWFLDSPDYTKEFVTDYKGTGVGGVLVTCQEAGYVGNCIFLPYTGGWDGTAYMEENGHYWTSTIINDGIAVGLYFQGDTDVFCFMDYFRRVGIAVRPVSE